jgi:hypothetical protein
MRASHNRIAYKRIKYKESNKVGNTIQGKVDHRNNASIANICQKSRNRQDVSTKTHLI